MDNVTHSLIGIALARTVPERRLAERTGLIAAAILGANLPDFDFIIPSLMSSEGGHKLSYLLQHRGFTHAWS